MGKFVKVRHHGGWVLVEHYVGKDLNPLDTRWVDGRLVRQTSMEEAFDRADPKFDPTAEDKTDPMIRPKA